MFKIKPSLYDDRMMKYFTFLFVFCLLFCFCSCQKEKAGCTDVSAINYNPDAEIEAGTCKYCDPYLSPIITYAIESEDPSDLALDVPLGDIKLELGCELIIEIVDLCFCLNDSEITWTPAEIFDCPSCAKVTISPTESVEVTLDIDNVDGYYCSNTFQVSVPE